SPWPPDGDDVIGIDATDIISDYREGSEPGGRWADAATFREDCQMLLGDDYRYLAAMLPAAASVATPPPEPSPAVAAPTLTVAAPAPAPAPVVLDPSSVVCGACERFHFAFVPLPLAGAAAEAMAAAGRGWLWVRNGDRMETLLDGHLAGTGIECREVE